MGPVGLQGVFLPVHRQGTVFVHGHRELLVRTGDGQLRRVGGKGQLGRRPVNVAHRNLCHRAVARLVHKQILEGAVLGDGDLQRRLVVIDDARLAGGGTEDALVRRHGHGHRKGDVIPAPFQLRGLHVHGGNHLVDGFLRQIHFGFCAFAVGGRNLEPEADPALLEAHRQTVEGDRRAGVAVLDILDVPVGSSVQSDPL